MMQVMVRDWSTPGVVSDTDVSFGAGLGMFPTIAEIPDEFNMYSGDRTIWNKVFSEWFFKGMNAGVLVAKKGIDNTKAIRYLTALMRSWEPKHGHKEAAVAYLMSLWFETPNLKKISKV